MLILVAFLSPFFGYMLDKWNPKIMMLIGINGLFFNKETYLNDLQKTVAERGDFVSLSFLCGLIGKLIFGFMSDKFSKKGTMIISIANLLLGS